MTTYAAATTTTEEIPTMTNNQATLHKLDQMQNPVQKSH